MDLAFRQLKEVFSTAPIISPPEPGAPFILTTDACATGIGAALTQQLGDNVRHLGFFSRRLKTSQQIFRLRTGSLCHSGSLKALCTLNLRLQRLHTHGPQATPPFGLDGQRQQEIDAVDTDNPTIPSYNQVRTRRKQLSSRCPQQIVGLRSPFKKGRCWILQDSHRGQSHIPNRTATSKQSPHPQQDCEQS